MPTWSRCVPLFLWKLVGGLQRSAPLPALQWQGRHAAAQQCTLAPGRLKGVHAQWPLQQMTPPCGGSTRVCIPCAVRKLRLTPGWQVADMMKTNLEQEVQGYRGELARQEQVGADGARGEGRSVRVCVRQVG